MSLPSLTNLSLPQLQQALLELGEPRFRARQIMNWVFAKRIGEYSQMRNISPATQQKLAARFVLRKLELTHQLVSDAGDAVKFGFRLPDSEHGIESVLLLDRNRRTACLSSQVGCALGCRFCATATMGFIRDLTVEEIVGQLIGINDYLQQRGEPEVNQIVFMGMGEALSNFENFCQAITLLTDPNCFDLAPRRITVSTAGVVPSIDRLIAQGPAVQLAISLNSYCNDKRSSIMPINKRYPLEQLVAAAHRFVKARAMAVTFEYVVVQGENDTQEALGALTRLLHGLECKINCIPLNPTSTDYGSSPSFEHVQTFAQALYQRGITATVRRSRGQDISGACGQLFTKSR